MRVLQIPNYYYPNIGGIEQVAKDIATSLKSLEIDNQVICFSSDASKPDISIKRSETTKKNIDGIPVTFCSCVAKVASQSLSLSYGKELHKIINDFKPDKIIFHYPNPFVASILLRLIKPDTKLIVWWHSDIVKQKFLSKFFDKQNNRLLARASAIIATSPNYIDGSKWLTAYKDKVQVIPNCINEERLRITPEIQKKSNLVKEKYKGKTLCFSVGRHVPYKGFSSLIKAASLTDSSVHFVIGGSGPLTESLKEQARELNIDFVGRLNDEDLIAYFDACDIICFPSITKNEAFGISLAEGMYFGKPAITYTIPGSGVNYVNINGVTGIECENSNEMEYALAINELATNSDEREVLGENAHNRVCELFMLQSFTRSIETLINEV